MRRWLVTLVVLAACSPEAAAPPEPSPSPPPDPVTGIVTLVRLTGEEVTSLEVESEGRTYEILIDPAVDYGFNLRHLEEHRSDGDPVQVDIDVRGDRIYAVSILDA